MAQDQTDLSTFSLPEARKIVADLFEPQPVIYWTDLILSFALGAICFRLVREFPLFSWQQVLLVFGTAVGYYRAALFTHELVHLSSTGFKKFRIAWNLMVGIPFLMPSFTYYPHLDHHRRKSYGTRDDGEYLPLALGPRWGLLLYMGQILVIPIFIVVRFGLLTPLTWISPKLRDLIHQRASSMVQDPTFIRPLPTAEVLRMIRLQEICCFVFILIAAAVLTSPLLPWYLIIQGYCTAVVALTMNHLRTLGAHLYLNPGREMTFVEQLLDSVNFPASNKLGIIWAPVGLRFHALHHLFPSMPYHNLAEAHTRLMRELPADSLYRQTEHKSLIPVLLQLWRECGHSASRSVKQSKAA